MIDLDTLRERLALPADTAARGSGGEGRSPVREAAVSVVLRPAVTTPEVLLIKRATTPGDPWSGHMAFPGGKREAADPHLLATAIRETFEETGLKLPDAPPDWIGRLGEVSPRGPKRRPSGEPLGPILVTPFLFSVAPESEARAAAPDEVERVHWVPLAELASPAREGLYRMSIGGAVRSFPSIDVVGEQVWGLTWRILDELMARAGVRASRPGGRRREVDGGRYDK
jgi:8-oxo-dGTP pyrophosphatase MutT (NUDIX family)